MEYKLIIGCNGHSDESGFTYCSHFSNVVIESSEIPVHESEQVFFFLTHTCELDKRTCFDFNMVTNIINYLYKKYNIINENMLMKLQKLFIMYKQFGLYLKLE
jgi:hypothetical protein